MCEDEDDDLCKELRMAGYKPMSEMTQVEEKFFEKVIAIIYKEFHIYFTAKDLSIKRIICKQCGGEAFCVHIHSTINGRRHPGLLVDVDDFIEICTDCGTRSHGYDETYETNPELRTTNCPYCGRNIDQGDLKVFNRTSY